MEVMMLILPLHLTIQAGHEDVSVETFHKLQAASRQEARCIHMWFSVRAKNNGR
jgi:hypothetical protein